MIPPERLFEIPVYRVSQEAYLVAQAERERAWFDARLSDHEAMTGVSPDASVRDRARVDAQYAVGGPQWGYNEIMAWIALIHDGPGRVIKGYASLVGRRTVDGDRPRARYQRGFRPYPFVWGYPMMKVLEEWFGDGDSNEHIHRQLRSALAEVPTGRGPLKNKHVDLTAFDRIGRYVRWNDLLAAR